MTSLAANNILPLRIGDVMRIFTYAPDVNATPSMVLSTVILEKLLDVFSLAALFTITMHGGRAVSPKLRGGAEIGLAISAVGLLVLVFGAHTLQEPVRRMGAVRSRPISNACGASVCGSSACDCCMLRPRARASGCICWAI